MAKDKKIDQNINSTMLVENESVRVVICESRAVKRQRKVLFKILEVLGDESYTPKQMLHFIEGVVIEYAMTINKGNQTNAAIHLGITKDLLRKKLAEPLIVNVEGVNDEIF
ncbi:MAG: hypothetical protein HRT87_05190 [Legionellales bacterium]|nr:hypothetical protein [Legionellales bacterium]